jgi:hypothetical protein
MLYHETQFGISSETREGDEFGMTLYAGFINIKFEFNIMSMYNQVAIKLK